ncbi:MAG: UvrB/UvrC motif-containing protein [Candidatus Omnitrophica bacterium]|nr:UvrB/UvrC motif-containing protein [Candidatus Omnitrophota bacterium]
MLCDVCNKNSATVHLTEIINDKVVEMHICQSCAQDKATEVKGQLSISDFLDNLLSKDAIEKETANIKCSFCGLTLTDVSEKGRLGCRNCYVVYKSEVLPLLKKLHSWTKHKGKVPCSYQYKSLRQPREEELKKRLNRAVCLEEYEDAARFRDQIGEFKG